jgi:hypothetical protein
LVLRPDFYPRLGFLNAPRRGLSLSQQRVYPLIPTR